MKRHLISILLVFPILFFLGYKVLGPYRWTKNDLQLAAIAGDEMLPLFDQLERANEMYMYRIEQQSGSSNIPTVLSHYGKEANEIRKSVLILSKELQILRDNLAKKVGGHNPETALLINPHRSAIFSAEDKSNLKNAIADFKTNMSIALDTKELADDIDQASAELIADIEELPIGLSIYQILGFEMRLCKLENSLLQKIKKDLNLEFYKLYHK